MYLVANLAVGRWYQKCWDPDCRSFRSEGGEIPSFAVEPEPDGEWLRELAELDLPVAFGEAI